MILSILHCDASYTFSYSEDSENVVLLPHTFFKRSVSKLTLADVDCYLANKLVS